jgi:hypothetical protein
MKKFVDVLLEELNPVIQKLVDAQKPEFEKLFKQKMSDTDEEMARLNLTYKLLSSIESYTLPTDKLVNFNSVGSSKGSIVISAVIERDGQPYNLSTEVISAGGYNIQGFHYRYLTNTKLPKKGDLTESKKIDEKIKRLTKVEKLEKEINYYKQRIDSAKESIIKYEKYSDEDFYDAYKESLIKRGEIIYEFPTWKEIVKRGADKNYDYSEELYDKRKIESKLSNISHAKYLFLENPKSSLKGYEKELKKLESKLEALKATGYELGGETKYTTPDYLVMFLGK